LQECYNWARNETDRSSSIEKAFRSPKKAADEMSLGFDKQSE